MSADFNIFRTISTALRSPEWGRGVSVSSPAGSLSPLPQRQVAGSGEGQAPAGRCAYDQVRAQRGKHAGLNSSAIRGAEDTAPRSYVVSPPEKRGYKRAAALCVAAAMGLSLAAAPPAFARRTFDSQITGFESPHSIAFDSNEDVWIDDGSKVDKYNPYPSQTLLTSGTAKTANPSDRVYIALDDVTGQLFGGNENCRRVEILNNSGVYEEAWNSIDEITPCEPVYVAIDNTKTYSQGRIYLSLPSPEDAVQVYDARRRPVDFPATAHYIEGNKLTGTPSGTFGRVEAITVGPNGNLYAVDSGKGVIDEFDSSGTFIRSFTGAGAPGFSPGRGVAVDPTNGNVLTTDGNEAIDEFDSSGNYLEQITEDPGSYNGRLYLNAASIGLNPDGYLYVPSGGRSGPKNNVVDIFSPSTLVPKVIYQTVSSVTTTSGVLNAEVDPNSGGNIIECKFEYGEAEGSYGLGTKTCLNENGEELGALGKPQISSPTDLHAEISGLTTEHAYHYRIVLSNANEDGTKYGADETFTPSNVLGLSTEAATSVTESAATLNASFTGNGEETYYYFEWGLTAAYGNKTSEPPADAGMPTGSKALSFNLTELSPYTTYHYRVVATSAAGTSFGEDEYFTTAPGIPSVRESVSDVHSDRAYLEGEINPNGGNTTYHFEYVDSADFKASGWAEAKTASGPEPGVGMSKEYRSVSTLVNGLNGGTVYHYRIVAVNEAGTSEPERTFTTVTFSPEINDHCPNAHVRQQTGAALLLDCRAYELVSAANAGGYDVESDLVARADPLRRLPRSEEFFRGTAGPLRHPRRRHPRNRRSDQPRRRPLRRHPRRRRLEHEVRRHPRQRPLRQCPLLPRPCWKPTLALTPSPSAAKKSARHALQTAAPATRSTCQMENWCRGWRARFPSRPPNPPASSASALSADGSHFVFGSKSRFEPDANEGEMSIYDRDLKTGETHVVSKTPAGQTMKEEGTEIGELDISKDGSRIVVGQLVSEEGNARYWHLYMNIGDSSKTIDLTPGTTHGVLFDGMTEDGSKVFFTTVDHLTNQDSRSQRRRHLSRPKSSEAGAATLHLISKGQETKASRQHRLLRPLRQHQARTLEHNRLRRKLRRRRGRRRRWGRLWGRHDLLPQPREARRRIQRRLRTPPTSTSPGPGSRPLRRHA